MSRRWSVQRALVAAALTVAAAPFAIGSELPGWLARPMTASAAVPEASTVFAPVPSESGAVVVDRAAKADRASVTTPGTASETFSIQPSGLSDTSVLVRVMKQPAAPQLQSPQLQSMERPALKPASRLGKPPVACEPVVSMLTEVAKQLAPGRCIT